MAASPSGARREPPSFDEIDLSRAIADRKIEVDYQGRVDLSTDQVIGVEALARWRADQGEIPPARFVPVAERSGLIDELGRWILERACRDAVGFERQAGRPVRLSVNIAPSQLRADDLVDDVRRALRSSGYDPRRLELEITERQIVARDDETVARIERLRAAGIAIALDDFGVGRSGSYLSWLPVDTVKIDQRFVRAIDDGADGDLAELDRMIALARHAGAIVVGEGVETRTQLAYLRRRGCDQAQGFLFGPVLRVAQVVDMLGRPPR